MESIVAKNAELRSAFFMDELPVSEQFGQSIRAAKVTERLNQGTAS